MNFQRSSSENSECNEHSGVPITNFCSALECFKELCPECIENHYKHHKKIGTPPSITSLKNIKTKCLEKIKTVIIALNQEMEKCELDYLLDPEKIIKEGLHNINMFKEKILESINSYCTILEKNLVKTVNENLLQAEDFKKIFEHMKNVIKDLDYMHNKLENSNKLETIKKISILDVRHLIEKFRREIHSVMDTKSIFPINIVINENRLQNIFTKELEKLITLERIPLMKERDEPEEEESKEFTMCTPQKVSTIKGFKVNFTKSSPKSRLYASTIEKQQKQTYHAIDKFNITMDDHFIKGENTFPCLHFFQNNSKNFFFMNLMDFKKNKNNPFTQITLDIDFKIPKFHKSIVTPNGDIYLIGGAFNDMAETMNKSANIYIYRPKEKTLELLGNMNHPRSSHSICYCNGCIYIVCGITNNQIFLEKCERFNIAKKEVEEICPVNYPVACGCVCAFFQEYLFKFGGISYNQEGESVLSQTIEKYDVIRDKWFVLNVSIIPMIPEQFNAKKETGNNNYFGLLSTSACCQINQSEILVFGGYSQNNSGSNQTFSFHVDYSDMESNDNCYINNINRIPLPFAEGFWENSPVVFNRKLYALQNKANLENEENCLENERRVLEFDCWKWIAHN